MPTQAKSNKPRLRAARGAYAIFRDDQDGRLAWVPIQLWRENEDGSWAGLVVGDNGLADAKAFSNFVQYDTRKTYRR